MASSSDDEIWEYTSSGIKSCHIGKETKPQVKNVATISKDKGSVKLNASQGTKPKSRFLPASGTEKVTKNNSGNNINKRSTKSVGGQCKSSSAEKNTQPAKMFFSQFAGTKRKASTEISILEVKHSKLYATQPNTSRAFSLFDAPESKLSSSSMIQPEVKSHCPSCQIPFTILRLQSPSAHVNICMDSPLKATTECLVGFRCNSTLESHYANFKHTLLARQRDGFDVTTLGRIPDELSPVQNRAVKQFNFTGSGNKSNRLSLSTPDKRSNTVTSPYFSNPKSCSVSCSPVKKRPVSKSSTARKSLLFIQSSTSTHELSQSSESTTCSSPPESLSQLMATAQLPTDSESVLDTEDEDIFSDSPPRKNASESEYEKDLMDMIADAMDEPKVMPKITFKPIEECTFENFVNSPKKEDIPQIYIDKADGNIMSMSMLESSADPESISNSMAESMDESMDKDNLVVGSIDLSYILLSTNKDEDSQSDISVSNAISNGQTPIADNSISFTNFKKPTPVKMPHLVQSQESNFTAISDSPQCKKTGLQEKSPLFIQSPQKGVTAISPCMRQSSIKGFFITNRTRTTKGPVPLISDDNKLLSAPLSGGVKGTATKSTYGSWKGKNINGMEVNSGRCRKKKQCPFYKKLPGTPFTVDAFSYGAVTDCKAYILSHFHYDHYQGLTRKFNQPIYCSQITGNLVVRRLKIDTQYVNTIPLNTPRIIHGVELTFMEANHCPGSVIMLLKLADGRVYLHTGDFRACTEMEQYPALQALHINTLYLDTTYCDAQYAFPSQKDVVAYSVAKAEEFLGANPNGIIVVGSYTIGKERIFMAIAEWLNARICVSAEKFKILDCLQNSDLVQRLTLNKQEARVHVLPMRQLRYENLSEYLSKLKSPYDSILAFEPTGWTHARGTRHTTLDKLRPKLNRNRITVYGVPYSEHSSYTEMRHFCQVMRPDSIIATVNNGSNASRSKMEKLFKEWMNAPQTPKKRSSQTNLNGWVK